GNPDRHLLLWLVIDRRAFGAIELALEADPVLGPQFVDQIDRLAQPVTSLLGARPFDAARRHLVQRLAGADTEHDAAGTHRAEGPERLGHDRGVIAKGRGEDAGADHSPSRACPKRAEPDERRRRVPVGMLPRLEMVADEDRVEADLLGEAREIEQLLRGELLGRGLVSEFQHRSLLSSRIYNEAVSL